MNIEAESVKIQKVAKRSQKISKSSHSLNVSQPANEPCRAATLLHLPLPSSIHCCRRRPPKFHISLTTMHLDKNTITRLYTVISNSHFSLFPSSLWLPPYNCTDIQYHFSFGILTIWRKSIFCTVYSFDQISLFGDVIVASDVRSAWRPIDSTNLRTAQWIPQFSTSH